MHNLTRSTSGVDQIKENLSDYPDPLVDVFAMSNNKLIANDVSLLGI